MSSITLDRVNLYYRKRQDRRIKDFLIRGNSRFGAIEDDGRVHAIRNVSLEVHDGDRLAIIGSNGAGKSSLLKVMSGIYPPSDGTLAVEGKISSLFELSTGFEQEQSGWKNIYLRGLMLGETPDGIRQKMNEIAEFSELGDYLNMPVKYYSSGMYVRLAFSVSTAITPDILLMDEVIAAGDASFLDKAKKRMRDLMKAAQIMVLVTHSMESAKSMCNKCIWFNRGEIAMAGTPKEVTKAYIDATVPK
ncbi:MAG: ABC transporter ATP-binding protein [Clostridiales Family XIII bacterium]|jgi:ABC-type polysaccharide/polyol phosphate transport system ATPase subunit|nr:ABC transporter ATP-binding protein [Clostridiales Family XIII bacterium]